MKYETETILSFLQPISKSRASIRSTSILFLQRRESSKHNYYIIFPKVILKAIIINEVIEGAGYKRNLCVYQDWLTWIFGQNIKCVTMICDHLTESTQIDVAFLRSK